jgi:hypothetical protein
MSMCDGKNNLIQDIGVVAIVTGVIGTIISIFTASYTSVVSNTISAMNAILSFAFGIPSAILTYIAASDRLSYTVRQLKQMKVFAKV